MLWPHAMYGHVSIAHTCDSLSTLKKGDLYRDRMGNISCHRDSDSFAKIKSVIVVVVVGFMQEGQESSMSKD